jgi:hypothetical protein
MENVHNLNCMHNLILGEYISDDDKSYVVLELLNCFSELFFWQALLQKCNNEFLIWLKRINTNLKQPYNLVIYLEIVIA